MRLRLKPFMAEAFGREARLKPAVEDVFVRVPPAEAGVWGLDKTR